MTLAPLVPAEPDESVSARVAAICQLRVDFAVEVCRTAAWRAYDDAITLALGLDDDLTTKVEGR